MNQGSYDLRKDVDKLFNTLTSTKEYKIIPNAPAILHLEGAYKPSSITFTSYMSSHDGTDFFNGKLEVKYSTDGVTYVRDGSIETGHTITRTITSNTVNYVKCILYDSKNTVLDEQTVPVIRSDSAISIVIGNEAQIIPCNANGSLKEVFTFNVPVYCFKGTDYYPATYSSTDSSYNSAFTLMSTTNPTSSNSGNVSIRVDSAPTDSQGFCVLGFKVDGELITKKVSWAKVGDGTNGTNGTNGSGYQIVYCITDAETTPTAPTSSTTIYSTPTPDSTGTIPWEKNKWYNVPVPTTIERPYCWQSKRTYESNAWGDYQTPTHYSIFTRDGANGIDGIDGRDGKDATELTGDDIMTMIAGQNIDAQTIGGISIDGLMTTQVYSATINDKNGNPNCTVMKMGRLCIVNFVSYMCSIGSTSNLYYTFASLPTWAYPISIMHTLVIPNYAEIVRIGDTGEIGIRTTNHSVNDVVNISCTFVYFADNTVTKKTTSITFDNTTVESSNPVTITLQRTNENGTLVNFENTSVEFEIYGKTYTRQTNSNGKASLNLNYNAGTYSITARFKGDSVNAQTSTSQNITVTAVSNPSLTISSTYATLMNSSTPMQNVPCIVTVKNDTYQLNTDYNGKIDLTSILANYKGTVSVKVETNSTYRCAYTSATANLTGTKSTQEYRTTLTPSSIGGGYLNTDYSDKNGIKWNYATVGSLTFKNDGAYAITDILSNNTTAGALDVSFTINTTDMPTTAVIKRVTAYVRYASLLGWTGASKGSYNQGESKISLLRGDSTVGGSEKNFVIDTIPRTSCGVWYEVGYQWDINETNTSNKWNYPALHFTGITNRGGGVYGNNSRFGIDYAQLIIEYES